MTTKKGNFVEPFTGANKALGDMFLHFDSREDLEQTLAKSNEWCKIVLE